MTTTFQQATFTNKKEKYFGKSFSQGLSETPKWKSMQMPLPLYSIEAIILQILYVFDILDVKKRFILIHISRTPF